MIIPALLIEKYNNIEYKYIGHGKNWSTELYYLKELKLALFRKNLLLTDLISVTAYWSCMINIIFLDFDNNRRIFSFVTKFLQNHTGRKCLKSGIERPDQLPKSVDTRRKCFKGFHMTYSASYEGITSTCRCYCYNCLFFISSTTTILHLAVLIEWQQQTQFFIPYFQWYSMRGKCPCSKFFWSVFSRIWTEYREIFRISPHSVQMRENTDQKNFECGYVLRSDCSTNLLCPNCMAIVSTVYTSG